MTIAGTELDIFVCAVKLLHAPPCVCGIEESLATNHDQNHFFCRNINRTGVLHSFNKPLMIPLFPYPGKFQLPRALYWPPLVHATARLHDSRCSPCASRVHPYHRVHSSASSYNVYSNSSSQPPGQYVQVVLQFKDVFKAVC